MADRNAQQADDTNVVYRLSVWSKRQRLVHDEWAFDPVMQGQG